MLLTQSTEMLTSQMLFLDLDSLLELCKVSSVTNAVCQDEWFWEEKTRIDFPEFRSDSDDSPRVTYILLDRGPLESVIRRDRADVYRQLLLEGRITIEPHTAIVSAVRSGATKILRLLLSLDDGDAYRSGLYLAADLGDTELLKVFGESGVEITEDVLFWTALSGNLEALGYLLTYFETVPPSLMSRLGEIYVREPEKGSVIRSVARWLDENG